MKRLMVLPVALAIMTGTSLAATPPPASAPPPQRTFISPSGEPFRPAPSAPAPFDAWFDQADTNHDGAIDRAEFRADAARFFKRLDANGDGIIDGFEIAAYERDIAPELAAQAEGRYAGEIVPDDGGGHDRSDADGHGRRRGDRGRGGQRGFAQLLDEPEPVSGADYDLDGRVTLAEWLRAADARFDLLDTAKTGRLTREALLQRLRGPAKPKR